MAWPRMLPLTCTGGFAMGRGFGFDAATLAGSTNSATRMCRRRLSLTAGPSRRVKGAAAHGWHERAGRRRAAAFAGLPPRGGCRGGLAIPGRCFAGRLRLPRLSRRLSLLHQYYLRAGQPPPPGARVRPWPWRWRAWLAWHSHPGRFNWPGRPRLLRRLIGQFRFTRYIGWQAIAAPRAPRAADGRRTQFRLAAWLNWPPPLSPPLLVLSCQSALAWSMNGMREFAGAFG